MASSNNGPGALLVRDTLRERNALGSLRRGASPATVEDPVAACRLAEAAKQTQAERERALGYWYYGARFGVGPNGTPTRVFGSDAPGAHPRSLLQESEAVHGSSKGLPVYNAGKVTFEPYARAAADLRERPNVADHRSRSTQGFQVNYPLPWKHRQRSRHPLTAAVVGEGGEPDVTVDTLASTISEAGSAEAVGPTPAYLSPRLAYSTNHATCARPAAAPAALQARPPPAGARLPRPSPPTSAFRKAQQQREVPLVFRSEPGGSPVAWLWTPEVLDEAAEAGTPRCKYSCETILVLCCEGTRELETHVHAMAVYGTWPCLPAPHACLP